MEWHQELEFDAIPAVYRTKRGDFKEINDIAYFWSNMNFSEKQSYFMR